MDARQPLPPDPICPVCSRAIYAGDHVIFGHGDLTHLQCHLGVRDLGDVVEGFLRRNPESFFCHTCLATALDITFAEARKATARLRLTGEFRVGPADCSGCGTSRLTVTASPTLA